MADLAWFPFYVADFLSSRRTRTMTAEQVGIYLLLLCEQWDHGPIPDDMDEVADIARADRSQAEATLRRCFDLTAGGWVNARLEEIRAEQEAKSARLSEAGRRGGLKSGIARTSKPGLSQAKPGLERSQAQARLKPGSSIRREEIREEKKREETDRHAALSDWLGPHADCLDGLDRIHQAAWWGLWGPTGTRIGDWHGMDPRPDILASAIIAWKTTKPRNVYQPLCAKILARAVDDAIASDRQAEQRDSEREVANELRESALAREREEIERLNAEAAAVAAKPEPTPPRPPSVRGSGLTRISA